MEPQNQYFYGRPERPTPMQPQQPDPAFPVNNMDHSKMGPMMRALTEDFDMGAQNSSPSYPQQSVPSMSGVPDQQRMPSNNFGPASQTLSGYASQYSSGQGSHNYFGQGHPTSPLNSGFSSPGGNYPPPGGMNNPYPRQMPASSPLGSPNGHGHSYPRSNSAGPTVPSPVMMHGQGMFPHNQTSPGPGNRTNAPFGFPPSSPTSPHNHLNHTSPPLASPSAMRPGGNLHSPKSVPASSPVPFASQMSPPASRAQSVPTYPGNAVDHMPSAPHSRSKSPGSAGIHRPFPQPISQPQHLYPLPSPKVRPVDQTDGRGQYVELVHSKPQGEQWSQSEQQRNNRSRNNSGQRRVSDPGHLPRLEEMVAVLGDSKVKESLDEIVSDKNIMFSENGAPEIGSPDNGNHSHNNEKRTQKNGERDSNSTEKAKEGLSNGFVDRGDVVNGKDGPVNGSSNGKSDEEVPSVKKVMKTFSGKATNANKSTDVSKDVNPDSPNSTNNGNKPSVKETVFKSPVSRPSKPQNPVQTKEKKDMPSAPESKCQSESTKHSLDSEPALSVPSTSTPNPQDEKSVPRAQTPPFNNPMTTPTIKKNSPEDSGSSTGNDSLPLKKRRGRPPGSKTRKEGEEGKPKRRYTKKKKLEMDTEAEKEQTKPKLGKGKMESGAAVARGPVLRVQGSSMDSVVSCQVVNAPDEALKEEALKKGGKKKPKKVIKHVKRHGVIFSGNMGHAVVLATECESPTGLWVCALCGNPPNFGILGDLYGPYHPPGSDAPGSKRERSSKSDRHRGGHSRDWHQRSRDGRRWSGSSNSRDGRSHSAEGRGQKGRSLSARQVEPSRNRKWRQVKTYMDEMGLTMGRRKRRHSEGGDGMGEVWIHEECAVWSQGVIFFQGALYGIHEAVVESEGKKCSLCRETGASIGCLSKGCKHVYHYLCAIEAECQMHHDNYSMTCPKHKDKKVKIRGAP